MLSSWIVSRARIIDGRILLHTVDGMARGRRQIPQKTSEGYDGLHVGQGRPLDDLPRTRCARSSSTDRLTQVST